MERPTNDSSPPRKQINVTKVVDLNVIGLPKLGSSLRGLKNTHFFRWLNGDFDHLGVWNFPPEPVPQGLLIEKTRTPHPDTLSADPDAQAFVVLRNDAESTAMRICSEAGLTFTGSSQLIPMPSQPSETKLPGKPSQDTAQMPPTLWPEARYLCDGCKRSIEGTELSFYCSICNGGDYDLCQDCIHQGRRCSGGDHFLHMTTGRGHRGSRSTRIFGSRKILKELGSSQSLQWDDGPLVSALDSYLAHVDAKSHPRAKQYFFTNAYSLSSMANHEITIVLRKWAQICILLAEDVLVPSFRSTLTPLQLASVRLLLEWWMGEIQDYRLTLMGIHGLFVSFLLPRTEDQHMAENAAIYDLITGGAKSKYHSSMRDLLCSEFGSNHPKRSPNKKPILHFHRESAATFACIQRSAVRLCNPSPIPSWLSDSNTASIGNVLFAAMERHKKMLMTSSIHSAFLNLRGPLFDTYLDVYQRACEGSVLLATENFIQFEQVLGKNSLSSSLVSCPWLSQTEAFSNLPHFLWDVRKRKTIRVEDLHFEPIYTAISHTWGRWRLDGEFAKIDGVRWPVPRNSRFCVDMLPTILENVPGQSPYIWFDLLCIPQDPQDPELSELQRQEISRQAGIFSNAEHVIAWFSDVETIHSLKMVAQILAANALMYPPLIDMPSLESMRLMKDWDWNFDDPLMKRNRPDGDGLIPTPWYYHVHEWLTSLWTLQEVCMRPDMWLCSKDWDTLVLPVDAQTEDRTTLSMDALLSLLHHAGNPQVAIKDKEPIWTESQVFQSNLIFHYDNSLPSGKMVEKLPSIVSSLKACMHNCGLIQLPFITPASILVLGNNRFCKGSRAEAIMSVLGATRWIDQASSRMSTPAQLVLERYPLPFVEEVRQRLGHDVFFGGFHVKKPFESESVEAILADHDSSRKEFAGSLLPFGNYIGSNQQVVQPDLTEMLDEPHRSLSTWEVCEDGSTLIRSASLLLSSAILRNPDSTAHLTGSGSHQSSLKVRITDLHEIARPEESSSHQGRYQLGHEYQPFDEWVRSRSYDLYAVCLACKSGRFLTVSEAPSWKSSGIILREVSEGHVVKTGWFKTELSEDRSTIFPEATELNLVAL